LPVVGRFWSLFSPIFGYFSRVFLQKSEKSRPNPPNNRKKTRQKETVPEAQGEGSVFDLEVTSQAHTSRLTETLMPKHTSVQNSPSANLRTCRRKILNLEFPRVTRPEIDALFGYFDLDLSGFIDLHEIKDRLSGDFGRCFHRSSAISVVFFFKNRRNRDR